jgi:hypothetical protein
VSVPLILYPWYGHHSLTATRLWLFSGGLSCHARPIHGRIRKSKIRAKAKVTCTQLSRDRGGPKNGGQSLLAVGNTHGCGREQQRERSFTTASESWLHHAGSMRDIAVQRTFVLINVQLIIYCRRFWVARIFRGGCCHCPPPATSSLRVLIT